MALCNSFALVSPATMAVFHLITFSDGGTASAMIGNKSTLLYLHPESPTMTSFLFPSATQHSPRVMESFSNPLNKSTNDPLNVDFHSTWSLDISLSYDKVQHRGPVFMPRWRSVPLHTRAMRNKHRERRCILSPRVSCSGLVGTENQCKQTFVESRRKKLITRAVLKIRCAWDIE